MPSRVTNAFVQDEPGQEGDDEGGGSGKVGRNRAHSAQDQGGESSDYQR